MARETAAARVWDSVVWKALRALPCRLRGRSSRAMRWSSSSQGAGWVIQLTRACAPIYCDSSRSPVRKVIRVPEPTRRNWMPSSSASKQPNVLRSVEPPALPV